VYCSNALPFLSLSVWKERKKIQAKILFHIKIGGKQPPFSGKATLYPTLTPPPSSSTNQGLSLYPTCPQTNLVTLASPLSKYKDVDHSSPSLDAHFTPSHTLSLTLVAQAVPLPSLLVERKDFFPGLCTEEGDHALEPYPLSTLFLLYNLPLQLIYLTL
jgi:hypothetical protein